MRSDDAAGWPQTLTAGGIRREITTHLQLQAATRHEITEQHQFGVLDNWVVRGSRHDESGRPSMAYLGWVEHGGVERLMRVAVSMDDRRIVTAFLDTAATEKLNSADFDYFQRNYGRLEIRNEAESAL